jgi:hypothetical protein
VDALANSLSFLGKIQSNTSVLEERMQRFNELKTRLAGVQNEIQKAELIEQYLQEQKQQLREQLAGLNFERQLTKLHKDAGKFSVLIRDYKQVLNDPGKIQHIVLKKLKRLPSFNQFFAQNSALASLIPGGSLFDPTQFAGMQTQSLSSQLVQNTINAGGPNATQIVTQQIQQAQNTLTNAVNRLPGGGGSLTMPQYTEQSMRSKTFIQRLELGANIQFARANNLIPQTSDIAGQMAYRFSKKGSIGIGASYRMGLGTALNNIRINHQGFGLRSFADFKLKGSFFINGGFEQNYNAIFNRLEELRNFSRWTGSALLGLSKKYNINKKLKGNVQLLYDFLHRSRIPNTQPILFRFGYNF